MKTQRKWGLELFSLYREQSGFLEAESKDFFALKVLLVFCVYSAHNYCHRTTNIKMSTHWTSQKGSVLPPVCPGVRVKNVPAITGKEESDKKVTLRL